MRLHEIDLAEYLETRRRMRLLPNLLDFGIAYGIFRPVANFYQSVRPLATFAGRSVGDLLYTFMVSDPVGFAVAACGYAVYAIVAAALNGLIGVKLKTLVLSDSRLTIWIMAAIFAAVTLGYLASMPGGMKATALIPGVYLFACARCLSGLNKLQKIPAYRHLVGVPRRAFAYSTSRYAFFSRQSLAVYGHALRSAWRMALGYLGIAMITILAVVALQSGVFGDVEQWFDGLAGIWQVVLAIVAVVALSQVIAYVRKFVANEWQRWVRQLRVRLARSAAVLSQYDKRPPILLLRSFQDDAILIANERFWGHRFLGVKDELVRLEEVLAEALYAYGPLVALSNPQDDLPRLGAARDNIANAEWQDAVEAHMGEASRIVLVAGATPSLRWEVDRLVARGMLAKTVVVFPPADHTGGSDGAASDGARIGESATSNEARLLRRCLPNLAAAMGLSADAEEAECLHGALVAAGGTDDRWTVVRVGAGRAGDARAYADAVRLAMVYGRDQPPQ